MSHDILRSALSILGVGGSFRTVNPLASSVCYNLARKLGIKIGVHRLPDGTYEVTRKS
jgi:hypothetical protein